MTKDLLRITYRVFDEFEKYSFGLKTIKEVEDEDKMTQIK